MTHRRLKLADCYTIQVGQALYTLSADRGLWKYTGLTLLMQTFTKTRLSPPNFDKTLFDVACFENISLWVIGGYQFEEE